MRLIAVFNLKGGVAKTTTVINTAAFLAAGHNKKVLIVDADSQCNSTEFMQRDAVHPYTMKDLLSKGYDRSAAHIEHSSFEGVDLLPADEEMMDLDLSKIELGSASATCLRDMLRGPEGIGWAYDYVLIDCPTAFSAASVAALVAADEVLIPVKLEAFSLRGMANIVRQVFNMRKINQGLKIAGILPTIWYKSENILKSEAIIRKSDFHVFSHVRRSNKVDDMTFAQEPLLIFSPKSAAARDYFRFVAELERRGK